MTVVDPLTRDIAEGGTEYPGEPPAWVDFADDHRLVVFVPGKPEPKGSAKAFVRGKRAIVVADNRETQRDWSAYVRDAARQVWGDRNPHAGPVSIHIDFVMPRRASAPKRSTPPHTRKPDSDKLTRCVWDALTHVVWVDDAQVTAWSGTKREAEIGETPGARIRVALR